MRKLIREAEEEGVEMPRTIILCPGDNLLAIGRIHPFIARNTEFGKTWRTQMTSKVIG